MCLYWWKNRKLKFVIDSAFIKCRSDLRRLNEMQSRQLGSGLIGNADKTVNLNITSSANC